MPSFNTQSPCPLEQEPNHHLLKQQEVLCLRTSFETDSLWNYLTPAIEHVPMGASSISGPEANPEPALDVEQRADLRAPEYLQGGNAKSKDTSSGSAGTDVQAAASRATDSANKVQEKHATERGV
ncbi:hypothetical protein K439DRAFT_1614969 [Ramaria rubella]|nr:hypothetical protein K439DRAFT_1614969 [Ramaria rubella]